ncbi:MAG: leucine-rich repeat protein [Alistipes sp.]|nr:leucine-rich repeat protein [Alistipes sp.]
MKKFIFSTAALSLLFSACTEHYEQDQVVVLTEYQDLTASFDEQSRTYVEDGKDLRWHADDRLTVFYGNTLNNQYKFNGDTGDNSGTFSVVPSSDLGTGNALNSIYALYPYDTSATILESGEITYHLPAVQSYDKDSFGRNANSMVAVTNGPTDNFLAFRNLCGCLKIKLYGDITVSRIELQGNNGEKIAGAATILAAYDDVPTLTMADNSTESITLDCGAGVALDNSKDNATTFWLVVPPTTFSKGITVYVTDSAGNVYGKRTEKSITIERNAIQPMAAFEINKTAYNIISTKKAIDAIYDSCASIEEFKTHIDQIAAMEGVAEVGHSDEAVYAVMESGFTLAWGGVDWPAPAADVTASFAQVASELANTTSSSSHDFLGENIANGKKLQVGIFNQTSNDNTNQHPAMRERFAQMERDFEAAGFDVDIVNHEQLSWEFYGTTFFDYDVILLHTHGVEIGDSRHWFMGRKTDLYSDRWVFCYARDDLHCIGCYRHKGVNYEIVSDRHFLRSQKRFKNDAIIFAAVCGSLRNNNAVAEIFRAKGAATYLGYDETTCAASHASVDFFYYMLQGKSAIQAFNSLRKGQILDNCPNHTDEPHIANLKLEGNENLCIVHPQLATDEAIVEGGLVTFVGSASGWNSHIDGDIGFVWSHMSVPTIEQGCEYNRVYSAGEQPGGEFTFTKREFDFQPNVTYYYRSYAKMGEEYIYGDIKTFVTEEANNVLFYRTTDEKIIGQTSGRPFLDFSSITVLSNTYTDGVGMIVCDEDITGLSSHSFNYGEGRETLVSVKLPNTIKWIQSETFMNYTKLESIKIPRDLTTIESGLFAGCSNLKMVEFNDNLVNIGETAFRDCSSLEQINLPKGLTKIGNRAFNGCLSLKSIQIPDGVTKIEHHTFSTCPGLESVVIGNGVTAIDNNAFYGASSLKDVTMGDNVVSIGAYAFHGCSSLTNISVSSSLESIGNEAFRDCSRLEQFSLPKGLTKIGIRAFNGCLSLKSIQIPDGVTKIEHHTFSTCPGLESVVIGNGVTAIDEFAFYGASSLLSVDIPDSVTTIGSHVFYGCSSLSRITIGKSVSTIGEQCFNGCTGHLVIKCNIPSIFSRELYLFYGAKFTSLTISDDPTNICDALFRNDKYLERVTIGKGIGSVKNYMFEGCPKLKEVIILDGISGVGDASFKGCTALTSVSLPNTLKSIGVSAFAGCTSLSDISLPVGVSNIGDRAFAGDNSLTNITISEGVTSIGKSAFENCSSLRNIELPESVTSIGDYVFQYCSNLESIKLSNSLTSIGAYAFRGCSALTSIDIPHSVTYMGSYAFHKCQNLSIIIIGNGLTHIPDWCFEGNKKISSVKLGNSITSIGRYAFEYCENLKNIDFPESLLEIGDCAFYSCGFTTITIPRNVIRLVGNTFSFCENLKSVYCRPTSPPEITGRNTFHRTSALKIYVPKGSLDRYKAAKWWSDECVLPHLVGY